MTALKQFDRLEAPGLYTPGGESQRVDVILSVGQASLTITDHRDVALAHWSLAAVERTNPGKHPAIFAPGPESDERIETGDETMIAAIEKVRAAVERGRPHPGKLRFRLLLAAVAAGLAVAVVWLPGAIVTTTARIVPEAARAVIGETLLAEIGRVAGVSCREPAGADALARLVSRLSPEGPRQAHVLPGAPAGARHLPGGISVLSRGIVEDYETPEVAAGYLLAEAERAAETDPLIPLLSHAGLIATVRLATTGHLPEAALTDYGEALMTAPNPVLDAAPLAARFARAEVRLMPYALALDITGEAVLPLVETAEIAPIDPRPLLTDGQWVALQGICGG